MHCPQFVAKDFFKNKKNKVINSIQSITWAQSTAFFARNSVATSLTCLTDFLFYFLFSVNFYDIILECREYSQYLFSCDSIFYPFKKNSR